MLLLRAPPSWSHHNLCVNNHGINGSLSWKEHCYHTCCTWTRSTVYRLILFQVERLYASRLSWWICRDIHFGSLLHYACYPNVLQDKLSLSILWSNVRSRQARLRFNSEWMCTVCWTIFHRVRFHGNRIFIPNETLLLIHSVQVCPPADCNQRGNSGEERDSKRSSTRDAASRITNCSWWSWTWCGTTPLKSFCTITAARTI